LAGTKLIDVHLLIHIFFIPIWTSTSAFTGRVVWIVC
jgi:hypothetical protein